MLDFLGLASQASSEKEKPRSFRMSSELANVAPTEEEVKYLFVNPTDLWLYSQKASFDGSSYSLLSQLNSAI